MINAVNPLLPSYFVSNQLSYYAKAAAVIFPVFLFAKLFHHLGLGNTTFVVFCTQALLFAIKTFTFDPQKHRKKSWNV